MTIQHKRNTKSQEKKTKIKLKIKHIRNICKNSLGCNDNPWFTEVRIIVSHTTTWMINMYVISVQRKADTYAKCST